MNWKKLIFLTSISASATPVWAFSVEQAVATTIATNPELKSAFNDFMGVREDISTAQASYLPDVNFDAGYGYEYTNNNTIRTSGQKNLNRKDANLRLTQLLWDKSTLNNIERTEYEAEAQRFQLLSDAQNKTLRVTDVYIAVLKTKQLLSLSEANIAVHNTILSHITRRTESGIGSTADLSQIEARVAHAITSMLAARSNHEDANSEFYRVVGVTLDHAVDPKVDALALPQTRHSALKTAIKLNPVIKLAILDIQAARAQYRQNKGLLYPKLTFEANQSWRNDANGIEEQTDEFSVMLRFHINLYNGGSDLSNIRHSAYQINKSKNIFDNATRLLEESTYLAWNAYQLTEQQKIYLAEHVNAASETVIAYEKQFHIGRRTLLDLLNTENELFEARRAYLDAHYANITAKYRVLNSTGTLLNALRVNVPQEWLESILYRED
ncbi:TolC family outer membrane protein [Candidatus Enterovibrio altilux]|uniref:TolC family outer membrane protein n=1 Tax=Candidatus Enterovibrio altilux TaxID=1927128 RepID=UPI000BBCE0AE|nr:TolC family outer membrane protein [Candidatus Enterovibrio luxaltus]